MDDRSFRDVYWKPLLETDVSLIAADLETNMYNVRCACELTELMP